MNLPTSPNDIHADRIRRLTEARQRIFALPPKQAVNSILEHPQSAALVHSFPETDLHVLLHDIGMDHALPILALASNRQWEYLLDIEAWQRDRLDYRLTTAWLQLLLHADPNRLAAWCFADKLELLELYLFRNIEIRIRESDQAPSDLGEGFFTDDDTFYVRCIDYPVSNADEEAAKKGRNEMIAQLLRRLSSLDHPRYQGLLLESVSLIPAEMEEELFRQRNVRLGEKGLQPFSEAIGIYQSLRPGDLEARGRKIIHPPSANQQPLPIPQLASSVLEGDNLFVRALKGIGDPHAVEQLQIEFANLCNQIITADQIMVRNRQVLRLVTAKASGYLNIGLQRLLADSQQNRDAEAVECLRRHLLADLFRIGYGNALDLKWRAHQWRDQSWCHAHQVDLTFWDEAGLGVLGGLLIDRPQCYDPSLAGSRYRDFASLEDIQSARLRLERITALDQLFDQMDAVMPAVTDNRLITYKNLLLTLWARSWLGRPTSTSDTKQISIPLDVFKSFYASLWTIIGNRRIIADARKTEFLQWAATAAGCSPVELSDRLGAVFEQLFSALEDEFSTVGTGNLDTRHANLFLLAP